MVSIALATYNGERFLEEQLLSLAKQTLLPTELVVGDDGSNDRTVDLIRDFSKTAPFPVRFSVNDYNMGYEDNFLATASRCKATWIAFCDQDDVWLPNRLRNAYDFIQSSDSSLQLIVQDADVVDDSLKLKRNNMLNIDRIRTVPAHGHYGFWVIPGFCQTFRATLVKDYNWHNRGPSFYPDRKKLSHDIWICRLANAIGSTAYIPGSVALYRRHESVVTPENAPLDDAGQRLKYAKQADADAYWRLSDAAQQAAVALTEVSEKRTHYVGLDESAKLFRRMSKLYGFRETIHAERSFSKRMLAFARGVIAGGYFGNAFVSRGANAFSKDLMATLGLWRRMK